MKNRKNILALLLAAVMLLSLLTACGNNNEKPVTDEPGTETPAPSAAPTDGGSTGNEPTATAYKDTLTVALKAEPDTLDPQGTSQVVAFAVQMNIFDTLVRKDENGEIIPWLADEWERLDNLSVKFHIRDNAKWSDGTDVTAEDVKFSIARASVNPTSTGTMGVFDGDNTEVVDEKTVIVRTKTEFSSFFNYLASSRGSIVCKAAVEAMGEAEYGRMPVSSGFVKVDSWETGNAITCSRNEYFWGDPAEYENLVFRFITETASRAIELEAGTVDFIYDPGVTDCNRLKDDENFALYATDGYGMMQVLFNLSDPVMDNVNLRKALCHSVDIVAIAKAIYGDYATPAAGQFATPITNFLDIGVYAYDVELAKEALKEAGYENGVTLSVLINQSQDINDLAVMCKDYWSKIGINAEINTVASSEWVAAMRRGEAQIGPSFGTITTGDPGHALNMFNIVPNQMCHPKDEHANELLAKAKATYDDAERDAVYKELQQYCSDQYMQIPIATKKTMYLASAKVEGFWCDPSGTPWFGGVKVAE
ncbi:MAG: ABC transporter substrate-binding protein [bacterium]|nr:ABC transporter substrate-binding protein [bacterium]